MKRAAAIAGALLVLAIPATSQAANTTIRVRAIATSLTFATRSGSPFPSQPGDLVLGTARLVSAGKTIGRDQFACVQVDADRRPGTPSADDQCTATYRLPHGTLITAGKVSEDSRTNVEAIVGGTGAYRGARGQIVTVSVSRTVEREVLRFSK